VQMETNTGWRSVFIQVFGQTNCPFAVDFVFNLLFFGQTGFEEAELWEDGKYKALMDEKLRTQTGGPCIMTLADEDRSLLHMDVWQALSGWKSMERIDLMIKKQQILLLQNHLRDVYKDECMQINAKNMKIFILIWTGMVADSTTR